jgi:hypothetical protein
MQEEEEAECTERDPRGFDPSSSEEEDGNDEDDVEDVDGVDGVDADSSDSSSQVSSTTRRDKRIEVEDGVRQLTLQPWRGHSQVLDLESLVSEYETCEDGNEERGLFRQSVFQCVTNWLTAMECDNHSWDADTLRRCVLAGLQAARAQDGTAWLSSVVQCTLSCLETLCRESPAGVFKSPAMFLGLFTQSGGGERTSSDNIMFLRTAFGIPHVDVKLAGCMGRSVSYWLPGGCKELCTGAAESADGADGVGAASLPHGGCSSSGAGAGAGAGTGTGTDGGDFGVGVQKFCGAVASAVNGNSILHHMIEVAAKQVLEGQRADVTRKTVSRSYLQVLIPFMSPVAASIVAKHV